MQTPENRAININSLNGNAFPVCIKFVVADGIYRIDSTPVSVLETLDVISRDTFLVFNVDTSEYKSLEPITLKQLADKYLSYLETFDDETLLLTKENLTQLLNEISHYNFCLIDVRKEIETEKVIQIIELTGEWNEKTVIDKVDSSVFLSAHDDCYLYLETTDENVALGIIALQIKTLAATVADCSIDELNFNPRDLIVRDNFAIVITQNPVKDVGRTTWKILEGTFRDFVYSENIKDSEFELVYNELDDSIKIESVRSLTTSD